MVAAHRRGEPFPGIEQDFRVLVHVGPRNSEDVGTPDHRQPAADQSTRVLVLLGRAEEGRRGLADHCDARGIQVPELHQVVPGVLRRGHDEIRATDPVAPPLVGASPGAPGVVAEDIRNEVVHHQRFRDARDMRGARRVDRARAFERRDNEIDERPGAQCASKGGGGVPRLGDESGVRLPIADFSRRFGVNWPPVGPTFALPRHACRFAHRLSVRGFPLKLALL